MKLIELNLQDVLDLCRKHKVGNYFDLKDSLEQLFNRKVDLIEYGKNLNPIFKALVDKKKQLIYG